MFIEVKMLISNLNKEKQGNTVFCRSSQDACRVLPDMHPRIAEQGNTGVQDVRYAVKKW